MRTPRVGEGSTEVVNTSKVGYLNALESKFNMNRCNMFHLVRRNEDPSLKHESVTTANTRTQVTVAKSRALLCSVL